MWNIIQKVVNTKIVQTSSWWTLINVLLSTIKLSKKTKFSLIQSLTPLLILTPSLLTTGEYFTSQGTVPRATTDRAALLRQALAADLFCHNKLAKVEPCLVLADVLFPRTVPGPGDPFVLPSGYIRDGYILRAESEINLTLSSTQGYILSQLVISTCLLYARSRDCTQRNK